MLLILSKIHELIGAPKVGHKTKLQRLKKELNTLKLEYTKLSRKYMEDPENPILQEIEKTIKQKQEDLIILKITV